MKLRMLSNLSQVTQVVKDLNTDHSKSNIFTFWRDHSDVEKHLCSCFLAETPFQFSAAAYKLDLK